MSNQRPRSRPQTMVVGTLLESTTQHLLAGGLSVTEMVFVVPIDYSNPLFGSIRIFARGVTRNERPVVPLDNEEAQKKSQKPWFVYLEGGPGWGCRSPQNMPIIDLILDRGYQILLLDQRGTGLSTPVTADTLALCGSIKKQTEYLKLFRADSIVEDCEAIRKILTSQYPLELKKWTIFGQSFGGFCAFTYLSKHHEGLREVFTSGGIPPVGKSADDVYQATFATVIRRNESYYRKYPEDIDAVHKLVDHIKSKGGIKLPSGGSLTVRRFLTIGMHFGYTGGLDQVHEIILRMLLDLKQFKFIARPTLSAFENLVPLDDGILYAILHESIYCEGKASNWAAERVAKSYREFRWVSSMPSNSVIVQDHPLYFSGEMIFPFMFDTYPELAKLRLLAEMIAEHTAWPDLYSESQLAKNEVPVYAATFVDDMYVDFGLVQETVKKVKNCRQYITNNMYHDAIRSKAEQVMKALFALRDDVMD